MLIGVCTRNDITYPQSDYAVLKTAKIELAKCMSETLPGDIQNLVDMNIEVIMRIRHDGFGGDRAKGIGWHPEAVDFANYCLDVIDRFPMVDKFQLHNEPNHPHFYEGWGADDFHAERFNIWYVEVIKRIKNKVGKQVELIFPGLAVPHNDMNWLELCKDSIELSDALGVHCYWQNQNITDRIVLGNHLDDFWGGRYKQYHAKYPHKKLYALEVGNSNGQRRFMNDAHLFPVNLEVQAQEYMEWIAQAQSDNILSGCAFFILSSKDRGWEDDGFVWKRQSGEVMPIVHKLGER